MFGGSFSPVHKGHMAVAKSVLDRGLADEVWMMPCRRNPLKDGDTLLPDEERLILLRKAADYYNARLKEGAIRICTLEYELPTPSYTVRTMQTLMERYPDHRFRLLVGADSYLSFTQWKEWEWMERNLSPIAYPRPGYELKELHPGWTLLSEVEENEISSTEIRKITATNGDATRYMPWLTKPE